MHRVHLQLSTVGERFQGARFRYQLLEWARDYAARRGVCVLAFGFGNRDLRMVLSGDPTEITSFCRTLKASASRHDDALTWWETRKTPVTDLAADVAWCHAGPVDAGASSAWASPWSSHRDLCGFRRASFFDATPLRRAVSREEVERHLGAPDRAPRRARPPEQAPLMGLLRVSAAVIGVLPSDRRCFRLFVHLARMAGWETVNLASALALTPRRVRQLAAEDEPDLPLALWAFDDPRLAIVP
jgi:hypothetical protein